RFMIASRLRSADLRPKTKSLTSFAPTLPSVTLMFLKRLVLPLSPLTPSSLHTTLQLVRSSSSKQPSLKNTKSSPWQTITTIPSWSIKPLHSIRSVVTSNSLLMQKQLMTPSPFTRQNSLTSLVPLTPSPTSSPKTPMTPTCLKKCSHSSTLSGSCWATLQDRCLNLAAKGVFMPSPRSVSLKAPLCLRSMTWPNAVDRLKPFWLLRNLSLTRRQLKRNLTTSSIPGLSKTTPARRVAMGRVPARATTTTRVTKSPRATAAATLATTVTARSAANPDPTTTGDRETDQRGRHAS
ncbi:hypothetical protein BGZ52_008966, partial [Haplosporangium bisporale]